MKSPENIILLKNNGFETSKSEKHEECKRKFIMNDWSFENE